MNTFYHQLIRDYRINLHLSYWDDIVWLNRLIIPKEHRRKYIGTRIMNEFIKWLDENHYSSLLLVSSCYGTSEDVLIEFYRKFGYEITKLNNSNNIYMKRDSK